MSSLSVTACSVKLPWNLAEETETETEPTEVYEPTLEELLGFDGYQLVQGDIASKYQELNLQAVIDLTAIVNDRNIQHNIQSTIVHKTDENYSYSAITSTDSIGDNTTNDVLFSYVSINDNLEYYNSNYLGWKHKEYNVQEQYYSYSMSTSNMLVTLFEQNGDRLYVEGEVSSLSDSDFDTYMKYVLNQYGLSDASYTFRAVYDSGSLDILTLSATVTPIGSAVYGDYQCTIDNMMIAVTNVSYNDTDTVSIPQYVYDDISD
jgi:hypothetical protein